MSRTSWRPAYEEHIADGICHYPGCVTAPSIDQKFMVCSACKTVAYCGVECQRGHWKAHKKIIC
ncbi:hypothetical protein PILCRDRAFT_720708 [Piloderma croceum F 1598]|uniref:MYND-type domain-containing protein n=1 Tax=Piloderma croceum (strain F 1598) TaxID=765440 RepID=A0A0C3B8Y3_PILCF|nr:hypothetical protein PILCRDRAFT_720708 [Piloderma croceum F 1598]